MLSSDPGIDARKPKQAKFNSLTKKIMIFIHLMNIVFSAFIIVVVQWKFQRQILRCLTEKNVRRGKKKLHTGAGGHQSVIRTFLLLLNFDFTALGI